MVGGRVVQSVLIQELTYYLYCISNLQDYLHAVGIRKGVLAGASVVLNNKRWDKIYLFPSYANLPTRPLVCIHEAYGVSGDAPTRQI